MAFSYKKILVVGATSGIGLALAERFVSNNQKVIVAGRRKEHLDAFVEKHGEELASSYVFDVTRLDAIPKFASEVTKQHPDLDCVFVNSGIQRGFDFSKPESVDLDVLGMEFTTNYLACIHLTTAFLPHLQAQQSDTCLMYTTSGLALVPITRCANYCASKAAMHHWLLCLREQLKGGPGNVKVVELFPPLVDTELHDEKHQPDLKDVSLKGMPLEEYTDRTWAALQEGDDQIPVGMPEQAFNTFEKQRQVVFKQIVDMSAQMFKKDGSAL
ncbi:short-chain dehydrogenase/oxidoreductase [Aulographum hederae CBS 113979]|uniref:Short-chain dehydrogenase/oxidoreductase n=1 Tax=Aulographum hederae CBS 113979 TaxID=1176131 RepID=A0A6G1H9Q3_9PEZI|nr:short-chain dehydrogenase/oxidoreductase [Aulographum hederae CBS 113979]